jgi:hypothetical protein
MSKIFIFIFIINILFNSCASNKIKQNHINKYTNSSLNTLKVTNLKDYIKISLQDNAISSIEAILNKNKIPKIGKQGNKEEIIYLKNLKQVTIYKGYLDKKSIISSIKFVYLNGEVKQIGKILNLKRKTISRYKVKDKKIINYKSSFDGTYLKYLFLDIKEDENYTDTFKLSKKENIDYFHINADNLIHSIQTIYNNKQEKSTILGKENIGKKYKIYIKNINRIEIIKGYFNNQIQIASLVFQYKNGHSIRVGNMERVKFLSSKIQSIRSKISGYKILKENGYLRNIIFLK